MPKLKLPHSGASDHFYPWGARPKTIALTQRADAAPMPVFPAVRSRFLGAQLQRPATYEASLGAPRAACWGLAL